MKLNLPFFVPAFLAAVLIPGGSAVRAQEMPVLAEPGAGAPVSITSTEAVRPIREIRMMPRDKRALSLKEDERNPYAKRTPDVTVSKADLTEETESDRIRRLLNGIPVTGRTYGSRGIRLLAGDIIFEIGREVPKVLEDQTEVLVVENVTEDTLILGWVDPETREPTGKRLPITYDMRTTVAYQLAGQTSKKDAEDKDLKFGQMRRNNPSNALAEKTESETETETETETEPASDATVEGTVENELQELLKQGQ